MGFRIFSGAVLAIVVFIAAQKAGMQGSGAFVVARVPLISAAINVMTAPIFSVSALSGIFFIIVPLLPVRPLNLRFRIVPEWSRPSSRQSGTALRGLESLCSPLGDPQIFSGLRPLLPIPPKLEHSQIRIYGSPK